MARRHSLSSRCTSAGRLTAQLLLSFLTLSSTITATASQSVASENTEDLIPVPGLGPIYANPPERPPQDGIHQFTLRHIFHHGTYLDPKLHRRKDILNPKGDLWMLSEDGSKEKMAPLVARSRSTKIQRLVDRRPSVVEPMVAAAREQGEVWSLSPSAWTIDDVQGPNVTDKETVLTLAQMTADAYTEVPNTGDWRDVDGGFNSSLDFGWEGDGLRGHVFADETNSTIVIGLKGTSLAVFDGAETTTNDKENDNLFFSCCCAQQGQFTWRKVCDCATSTYTCNNTCVVKALRKENRYYQAVQHLYSNITAVYPDSNVWVVGHSLGGAVSSLLGMTYGLPTVTFEAPGEALAATRLGLPVPPGVNPSAHQTRENMGTHHFGHTADPIFLGTCNGATGSCSYGGYAMETACHAGFECVYDVVADLGWRVGVGTHRINSVIDDVIKKYETVPTCIATPECTDCALWKYYESNSSSTTTTISTSTSKTRTRTETCKTPGWWGCLDESTTTGATTTTREVSTTTSSTSSSTCKTPGWFGCYDKTTTTETSTLHTATKTSSSCTSTTSCHSPGYFGGCYDPTTMPSASPTTTQECKTPGFWGCKDETTSTEAPITSPPVLPSSTSQPDPPKSHECKSREWFGLICVDPSPTSSTVIPTSTEPPSHKQHCVRRNWFGMCKEWEDIDWQAVPEM